MTDWELLSRYRAGSEPAFAELVARHADWIYSAALRRMGNRQLAEDVAQATFIALSRDRKLREGAIMSAWLFQAMRFASANALRKEARRKRHESAAGRLRSGDAREAEVQWEEMAPLLEDAVAGLRKKDREAVLMRFYEKRSLAEVGAAMGISDEGARKRIARAVEKLRRWFAARGYASSGGTLSTALATGVVLKMPGSLVIESNATGSAAGLAQASLKMIRRSQMVRWWGAVAAVVAPIGIGAALLVGNGRAPVRATPPSVAPAPATIPAALLSNLPATRPTTVTLEQVIAGARASESAFHNLYVKDFRTTVDQLVVGKNIWKPTPVVQTGSAWYGANPEGNARVYYAQKVSPWEPYPGQRAVPGQVPWMDEEVDLSWDGRQGREVHIAGGFPGKKSHRDNSAMITPDRPILLDRYYRYETGIGFTLQYLVTEEERFSPHRPRVPLSQIIERAAKAGRPPELSEQIVNGVDTVRIRFANPRGSVNGLDMARVRRADRQATASQTYWLAPSRGYALVRQEMIVNMAREWSIETLDVSEMKEVAKGVWFPMRAKLVIPNIGTRGEYWRYNFSAGEVTANDPKFDPAIFTAKVPVGYVVSDQRAKNWRSYMAMPDGSKHELHRGSVLPNVKPAKPQRPDAKD